MGASASHREAVLRLWLLLALGACRRVGDPAELALCAGADPPPVPGFPAYRYSEVALPDGTTHAANWAWQPVAAVRVNVDVASFEDVEPDVILDIVDRALAYWSAAGPVTLELGDTGPWRGEDAACDGCATTGEVDVVFAPAPDHAGIPAYTRHVYGDDPTTEVTEAACLVGSTVRFFPEGVSAAGSPVAYAWVSEGRDVRDTDATDGTVEKPLHDTLVHELGHVLGLGDQDDPSVACSVMAHCRDPKCGCGFEVVGDLDAAAVSAVYEP